MKKHQRVKGEEREEETRLLEKVAERARERERDTKINEAGQRGGEKCRQ